MPNRSIQLFKCAALAVAALAMGCATEEATIKPNPVDAQVMTQARKDFTASLKETRSTAFKVKDQSTQTITTLERLVDGKETDLRPAYESFSKAIAALDAEAASMKSIATKNRSDGQKFFSYWETDLASYSKEDVRKEGESRRKEILGVFTDAQADLDKAVSSLNDLQVLVGDVKTYLGNTLSSEGVEQMSSATKEASKASKKLAGLIDDANEALDKVIKEMPSSDPHG
jgi:ABC-type transporter Mla subunit MlaD